MFSHTLMLGDGAMGTELIKTHPLLTSNLSSFNITHPEFVTEIHRRYIAAGAQIIFTNTFGAGLPALKKYGLAADFQKILEMGVACAQKTAQKNTLIVGDMGPSSLSREEALDYGFKKLARDFMEQARILEDSGVNALALETFTTHEELELALEACVEACHKIPVWASVSPRHDGTLSDGTLLEDWVDFLEKSPAAVLGVNCGESPASVIAAVKKMRTLSLKRLLIKPSVGIIYPVDAATFAREMEEAQNWGPCIVGGCCGTTPEYIVVLRKNFTNKEYE